MTSFYIKIPLPALKTAREKHANIKYLKKTLWKTVSERVSGLKIGLIENNANH